MSPRWRRRCSLCRPRLHAANPRQLHADAVRNSHMPIHSHIQPLAAPHSQPHAQHAVHLPRARLPACSLLALRPRRLSHMAGPLFLQNLFSFSTSAMAVGFVGHLGDPVLLSSAVLANSLYNVSGYSVVSGLSAGMETLCGQASAGCSSSSTRGRRHTCVVAVLGAAAPERRQARQQPARCQPSAALPGLSHVALTRWPQAYGARSYRALGLVLQRAVLIVWLICVPISILWTHAEPLLLLLGQPPAVAKGAAQ